MPLFALECADCQTQAEVLISGGSQPVCPSCGSMSVVKMPSAFAPMHGGSSAELPPMACGADRCCMGQGGCAVN